MIGAGRLFEVHPCSAQCWAGAESPIRWQVRASLTQMLRHGLKPQIIDETLPVPRMDQIVIVLMRQTGESLETAPQRCMTTDLSQAKCTRQSEAPRGLLQSPTLPSWRCTCNGSPADRAQVLKPDCFTPTFHVPGSGPLWQSAPGCDVGLSHLRSARSCSASGRRL